MNNVPPRFLRSLFFVLFVLALIPSEKICGADWNWIKEGLGNWNDINNWDPNSVPSGDNFAFINNGGTVEVTDSEALSGGHLRIGIPTGSGNLLISEGGGLEPLDFDSNAPEGSRSTVTVNNGGRFIPVYFTTRNTDLSINEGGFMAAGGTPQLFENTKLILRGVFQAPSANSDGTGSFVFDGGTYRSTQGGTDLLYNYPPDGVMVTSKGGTIDTNAQQNFIGSIIGGLGGMTITGGGNLTYNANNTYWGLTRITDNTTLTAGGANTVSPNSGMSVDGGSTFNLNGYSQVTGVLSGGGLITNDGAGPGPVTFTVGNDNQSGNFAGTIDDGTAGPVSLTKVGTGNQTLSGYNTYSGDTFINGGILTVDGVLAKSPNVFIGPNGILRGVGSIPGAITSSGIISPGDNTIGTLHVSNATLNSDSTLRIQLGSNNTSDLLASNGTVNLNGTTLELESLDGSEICGEFTILTATGGVNGTFGNVTGLSDVELLEGYQLVYNPNSVRLIIPCVALEPFEPVIIGRIKDMLFNAANTQFMQLTTRLAALRAGVGVYAYENYQGLSKEAMMEQYRRRESKIVNQQGQTLAYAQEKSHWDIYAFGTGIFSTMNSVNDLPKANVTTGYFGAGADYIMNNYISLGVYAGYQGIKTREREGNWLGSNGVKYGIYATAQCPGFSQWMGEPFLQNFFPRNHSSKNISSSEKMWDDDFYLNAIVGGGANYFNVKRSMDLRQNSRIARSHPFAGELDSLLGGGYEFRIGPWTLGANTSIQYTYVGVSSVRESGADQLNASLPRQNYSSLIYTLGGNLSYLWEIAPNYKLYPTVGLYWQHEFLNYAQNVNGHFSNRNRTRFDFESPAGFRNGAFATAGISAQIGRVGIYGYYTPQFGNNILVSQGVTVGISYAF